MNLTSLGTSYKWKSGNMCCFGTGLSHFIMSSKYIHAVASCVKIFFLLKSRSNNPYTQINIHTSFILSSTNGLHGWLPPSGNCKWYVYVHGVQISIWIPAFSYLGILPRSLIFICYITVAHPLHSPTDYSISLTFLVEHTLLIISPGDSGLLGF